MPSLDFTSFSGAVPRYGEYAAVEQDGILFIVPDKQSPVCRYDPFEDADSLLLDVTRAGAAVADCTPFLDFCLAHKMLPLRDAEFWACGDFFVSSPKEARPLADILLGFAGRYGLPAWEPQSVATAYYPARYERQMMELCRDEQNDAAYLLRYETVKRACRSSGAVPACTLALILLDFYLQFVEGVNDGQFAVRRADWLVSYGHEKTPRLTAQVYDLTACVNLAYALASTGEGKAVRQCKHCRKFFITDDWRSEYCSPRCRGAYNSKMTRKRVKERKAREGQ